MVQIVLYSPEIPPNTGNIARLCAAMNVPLNLIEPLGFSLEDRYLRRAGLDYWPHVRLRVWPGWSDFVRDRPAGRLVATSSRRGCPCQDVRFLPGDLLLFGPETTGLPPDVLDAADQVVNIPISPKVRSLNLSTAAGIILYEALRQTRLPDDRKSCLL